MATEARAVIDARCSRCKSQGNGEYRTTFSCSNCGLRGVAIHSKGHKATDSWSEECPRCECRFGVITFGDFLEEDDGAGA